MNKYPGNQLFRESWLQSALANISDNSRILDAGAGELQYKRFCGHLNYVAQDFGQYDGQGVKNSLQTGSWDNSKLDIVSDITEIPEPDGSFDAIMCVEVFEHIPEPIEALREFARLIKPGGTLIITAPVASLTHFAPYYFYNGFSRFFYEKHLENFGFEIEELVFNGNFYEQLIQEARRVEFVAHEHSKIKIGKLRGVLLDLGRKIFVNNLKWLSSNDKYSHKLHSFGIHVQARKRS